MKINLNFKTSILFIVLFLVSFLANAQKKMWTGKSYNFNIRDTTNPGSTITWSDTLLVSGLTRTIGTPSGTRGSVYDVTFTNSTTTSKTGTLRVSETSIASCATTNSLGIEVFPLPTLDSTASNFCATLATVSALNVTISNFAQIKGITANSNNFTFTYQLYDGSNVAVAGAGSSGTLTLTAGPSATVSSVSLSAGQLTSLSSIINAQSAGTYKLKINAFQTPLTPTSTEAGAVTSILNTIHTFTINALPVSNPIIAN